MMMSCSNTILTSLFFLLIFFLKLSYCTRNNGTVLCPKIEKQSLLNFKQGLIDPENVTSSWDGEVNCCKWKGVVCNNLTGHVHRLHLRGLSGKISPSLLHLKHLTHLDLSLNYFGETIPFFIGSFKNLEYLNLSGVGFHGKIPHTIGNLSNLHTLDLQINAYPLLEVDSLEWVSGLSQLEYLNMNSVNMSKATNWAQVINSLPSLRLLHFQHCSLDFMAPLNYVNTTSLTFLDLSRNYNFQSIANIPSWIFQLSNLLSLDLSFNKLEGPIPSSSINATKLQYIDLNANLINSSIPDWLYFCKDLEYVGLSLTELQGTVSNAIANLTSLNILLLDSNQLSGKIPREIASLCSLRSLKLDYNEFEGEISDSFGNMSECFLGALETISLSGNQLSGHLTDQFGEFKRIQYLDLSENSFSGEIPTSLGNLSSLEYLFLHENKFIGNLPGTFGQLFNLQFFYIDDNKLEGIVSEGHFANLTKIVTFSASGNQLTLNVSSNWIPPLQLTVVGLGSWRLGVGRSQEIPQWLHKLKNIINLDLSNTGISGGVPIWLWEIPVLNLSHNHLNGEIPYIKSTYYPDQSLYLSANQFNGSLPRIGENVVDLDLSNNSFSGGTSHFLCDKTYQTYRLQLFHLERNQLSGEMPDCWMKWPSLRYVNIGKNNMSGSISTSIGFLGSLRSLNLFGNKFSGQIPFSMHKCTKLVFINFGDNDLDGNLPAWMGTSLVNLMILILRSNKLSGKVSSKICHLNSLQILDLSNNQLSGRIPRCVYNFTAMATKQSLYEYSYGNGRTSLFVSLPSGLMESASVTTKGTEMQYDTILSLVRNIDLSRNNFSGDIPKELTNLVELRSLNLSENQLTGRIPDNIGDMKQLESLDLSRNYLSGEIPNSFTLMFSLNHLNLSFNYLTGRIPESTQLRSLDASSFIGNDLCGPPLTSNCSRGGSDEDKDEDEDEGDESHEIEWFWVFLSSGYALGLSIVFSALVLKKSWRDAYFGFLEEMWNKFYVYVHIKLAKLNL